MGPLHQIALGFERFLRAVSLALAMLSGAAIVGMMCVTCADVFMRAFGHPIRGAYDLVQILSVVTLAFALPYTTAVKGHVAVEILFHRLPRPWRIVVDSVMRLLVVVLFVLLAVRSVEYGARLRRAGELMATLHMPVYWIPWLIAFSCAMVALVVFHHLVRPGKAILRP